MLASFDIGFANTGYVIFDNKKPIACGVIKTEKTTKKNTRVSDDHSARSIVLAKNIDDLIYNYEIEGIIGELPSGGAQNARAMAFMMSAISIISSVGALCDLPMEWATPTDVKKAVTGKRSATKEEMMLRISQKFEFKIIKKKKRIDYITPFGKFPKGQFEHIADAFGVYLALQNDNLVKMFG